MNTSSPSPRAQVDWILIAFFALAAVLLFASLGNGYLWQDEAETALLARHTLRFGYPAAFDGRNLIDVPPPYTHGPGSAWLYAPWLPFYLLAFVFAIAGESTAFARLPFAFFGWLSIVLAWQLIRRLTTDVRIHRLTVALLTCCVPFLVYMRQCRYYSLATALLLSVCLAYLYYVEQPSRRRAWGVAMVLVLLFHTNFGTWIPVVGALLVHQARWGSRASRRLLLPPAVAVALLTVRVCVTFGAGPKFALPAWLALTVTVPSPVKVTVLPEIVAGPDAMVTLTGNPELAVALTVKGTSPKTLLLKAAKMIVWLPFPTVNV